MPNPLTAEAVHVLFRSARKAKGERPAVSAGPGARRKGELALAVADRLAEARETGTPVAVPTHLRELFEFLYPGPVGGSNAAPDADSDSAAPSNTDRTDGAAGAAGSTIHAASGETGSDSPLP